MSRYQPWLTFSGTLAVSLSGGISPLGNTVSRNIGSKVEETGNTNSPRGGLGPLLPPSVDF